MALHRIAKGLDIPLSGEPSAAIEDAVVPARVALLGADSIGLKPTLLVDVGDQVLRGTPLYEDKKTPGVRYTAPAAGVVAAIHRGDRRAFQSIVLDIDADDGPDRQVTFTRYSGAAPESLDAAAVGALLVESGMWPALRTRPFSHAPRPGTSPHALFVTAMDTRPHAPDVERIVASRAADFETGLIALSRLCEGKTYVCAAPETDLQLPKDPRIVREDFVGPHPAGTVGLHIDTLDPVDVGHAVWHIGYQDVLAVGRLVTTGSLDIERVITLAGPGALRPRHLRTRLGAALADVTRGAPGAQRVISGSVLDGSTAMGDVHGYLGRHHLQVAVVPEGSERELFGWIAPGIRKFSLWGVVFGAWSGQRVPLSTTTNGGPRAMVPIGAYERVMPLDLMPTFLLRALIIGDIERAEELGALALDEEDLALCTFVCPGKTEYGPLLRRVLERIEKESAT